MARGLEASGRFRRDTGLGDLFHRRKLSFREVAPTNAVHIVIDGSRVTAHVDRISPLKQRRDGSARYTLPRVVAHNVTGMWAHVARLATGVRRSPGCILECEVVWADDEPADGSSHGDRHHGAEGAPLQHPFQQGAVVDEPSRIPFSMVDEAVHLLDTEAAPWSIQLEARVAGRLDEQRLRAALPQALGAHPMARARKLASPSSDRRDKWEIASAPDVDPLQVVDCPDEEALAAARADLQSRAVPLGEAPPFRVRLARHPAGDVLMFNVNHAAMDGFGALRVLQSVARAYAGRPDPEPSPDLLEARAFLERLVDADVKTRVRRHLALAEKLRDLAFPPARVAPEGPSGEPGYGFHHVSLSAETTGRVVAFEHGGTVNDVLLAALHLAIAGWNADHGRRSGRIGVLVPANLRPSQWRQDVAANFSLPARVSTSGAARRSRPQVLRALTAQTRRKKRTGLGTAMLEPLSRSRLLPLWAKRALTTLIPLTGNRLVDTAMLSNMGSLAEPLSFGPEAGETVELWFSPPARMPLGLAVGAVTVAGRLHLAFRYRHRLFGPEAARHFAERYVKELELLLDDASVPLAG